MDDLNYTLAAAFLATVAFLLLLPGLIVRLGATETDRPSTRPASSNRKPWEDPAMTRTTHGWSRTPEYKAWQSMIQRCTNPKNHAYARYGGRGITVCDRWLAGFDAFLADMGPRPEGHSLDRVDVNGNYEPRNCRWATLSEQNANVRPRETCRAGHEYTPENTRMRTRANGRPTRQCITCAEATVALARRGPTRGWPDDRALPLRRRLL